MGTSGLPDIYTLSPRAAYKCNPNSIWIKAMKALYQRVVQRIVGNHLPWQYLNIALQFPLILPCKVVYVLVIPQKEYGILEVEC